MLEDVNGNRAGKNAEGNKRYVNTMALDKPTDRSQPNRRLPMDLSKNDPNDGLEKILNGLKETARSCWHSNDLLLGSTGKFLPFFPKKEKTSSFYPLRGLLPIFYHYVRYFLV